SGAGLAMTTSASTPSSAAAHATACAWLPAEMVITPRSRSSDVSALILLSAPRSLNEPVRWNSSHLRCAPRSGEYRVGVWTTAPPIASRARRTSSRVSTLPPRFEEDDGGSGGCVQAVGRAGRERDRDAPVGGVDPALRQPLVLGADGDRERAGEIGVGVARLGVRRRRHQVAWKRLNLGER